MDVLKTITVAFQLPSVAQKTSVIEHDIGTVGMIFLDNHYHSSLIRLGGLLSNKAPILTEKPNWSACKARSFSLNYVSTSKKEHACIRSSALLSERFD